MRASRRACDHHAPSPSEGAQLIGFPGCYPNAYAQDMMEALCTHPNVGAVLLVSLGCEQMNRPRLLEVIERSGGRFRSWSSRKAAARGARSNAGRDWVREAIGRARGDAAGAARASTIS